jgi:hypothetical protein
MLVYYLFKNDDYDLSSKNQEIPNMILIAVII